MVGDEYMDWASVSSINAFNRKKKGGKGVLMDLIVIILCNRWWLTHTPFKLRADIRVGLLPGMQYEHGTVFSLSTGSVSLISRIFDCFVHVY